MNYALKVYPSRRLSSGRVSKSASVSDATTYLMFITGLLTTLYLFIMTQLYINPLGKEEEKCRKYKEDYLAELRKTYDALIDCALCIRAQGARSLMERLLYETSNQVQEILNILEPDCRKIRRTAIWLSVTVIGYPLLVSLYYFEQGGALLALISFLFFFIPFCLVSVLVAQRWIKEYESDNSKIVNYKSKIDADFAEYNKYCKQKC